MPVPDAKISWSSDKPDIVSVDENGLVTALKFTLSSYFLEIHLAAPSKKQSSKITSYSVVGIK